MKARRIAVKNWWVVVVLSMSFALYLQAIHKKNERHALLNQKRVTYLSAKRVSLQKREELLLRLKSQNDPEFIEMLLKEKLGVVDEGETKVVFQ